VPELAAYDVELIRADNPSPFTLDGTNTWVLGRDPAWVIDPGPALPPHLAAVAAAVARRGGAGGIAVTHDHADHAEGVSALAERLGGPPVGAARLPGDAVLTEGDAFGPLRAHLVPGHAPDHLVFTAGPVAFTGDAVLGRGSVFVAPGAGGVGAYLAGLERLAALPLAVLCPGHGPPVWEPQRRLGEYVAHRRDREERLLAALAAGHRRVDELLDAAWDDVPASMRAPATVTLAAHLEKLRAEGRLPDGVEEPALPGWVGGV
jgi:glyoxylase-like metal-dependent hydrolase (beta-lactamase superfamily II)